MGNGKGLKAKNKLLEITGEYNFDLACAGWELEDIIKQDDMETMSKTYNDKEIKNECTICGQTHLNDSFLIRYTENDNRAIVGSSCIKRFIKFAGISNQQDSNRHFEKRKKEICNIKSIRELLADIFLDPIQAKVLTRFRKLCANILNLKEDELKGLYLTESWIKLIDILNQNMPNCKLSEKQEHRVKLILFNPKEIQIIKEKIKKDKPINIYKSKHRITTTLSRSEEYKNPSELIK